MQRTSLYRHFDAKGRLLYVGISGTHLIRLMKHRVSAKWYWDIANVTIEHFATLKEAMAAERGAIIKERPLFNASIFREDARSQPKRGGRKKRLGYAEMWEKAHAALSYALEAEPEHPWARR